MVVLISASCPSSRDNASLAANTYQDTFLPKITQRLNKMSRDYKLTGCIFMAVLIVDDDVRAMQYICPFQINALGQSPFCDIFSEEEWKDMNYLRDLWAYYAGAYILQVFLI